MDKRVPLFPVGSVLFPGLVLPLHIFEERYRQLVRDLLDRPEEERQFGVVAITQGHEVDAQALTKTADVGCMAEVRQVESYDDGRFDLVTTGTTRFRVESIDDSMAYLQADVAWLSEEEGDGAGAYIPGVLTLFERYCRLLRTLGASVEGPEELPDEPVHLSYLVAAAVILDRHERQRLLETEDSAVRLRHELGLLWREISVLQRFPALPASELLSTRFSSN